MNRNKMSFIIALFTGLGTLTCCDSNNTPGCSEGNHNYTFASNDTEHWNECSLCGKELDGSRKKHAFIDDETQISQNKAPTCTEDGYTFQKCECGLAKKEFTDALKHDFSIADDRSNVLSSTSTCTEAGEANIKCTRCGETSKVADAKIEHDWQEDPRGNNAPPRCDSYGYTFQQCSMCKEERVVYDDPVEHNYLTTKGVKEDGYSILNSFICSGCQSKGVFWDAKEVTDNCKENERIVDEGTDKEFREPNFVITDDGGIKFWGRPKGNACSLSAISGNNCNPIFDENVAGSFLEYKIKTTSRLVGVQLIAEYSPSKYLIDAGGLDLYKNDKSSDWTPGLVLDDKGEIKKLDFRYIISIDGIECTLGDGANPCTSTDRAWFTFPTNAVTLEPGEHTIKITMAGGYISTFYNFGFLVDPPIGHSHVFISDLSKTFNPTCTEEGRYYGICRCGMIKDERIPKLDHMLVDVPQDGLDLETICETATQRHVKCTREGCNYEDDIYVAIPGHDFVGYPNNNDIQPTCLTDGLETVKCSRCGKEETRPVGAFGHVFEDYGDPIIIDGCAPVQKQICNSGDAIRYVIKATDVTEATKNNKRLDMMFNGTLQEPFVEPNYVENSDGSVSFWGRSIHNRQYINERGSSTAEPKNIKELYDENIQGSFVEYKFKVGPDGLKGKLMMEATPYRWQNNVFAAASDNWAPGIADAEGNTYPTRYVITLNGQILEQDLSKDVCPILSRSAWYTVPLANDLDLQEGEYTLRFTMADDCKASFYNFAIETLVSEN